MKTSNDLWFFWKPWYRGKFFSAAFITSWGPVATNGVFIANCGLFFIVGYATVPQIRLN